MHKLSILLNVGLRGGGLVGKFLLIFFLARILTPAQMGTYGIFSATVSYSLYLIGLDFYIFAARSMASSKISKWPVMLRDQGVLFCCTYVLVFPLLSLIFLKDLLPADLVIVFYVLLVLEHLSQEFYRLLIIYGRPLAAGNVLFIRFGAWCYVLVATYLAGFTVISLSVVLWAWAVADLVALTLAMWLVRDLLSGMSVVSVNWSWIKQGLRVSAFFLVGTMALRGIFTFDRYFIEFFSNAEMLGAYTIYFGISSILIAFTDSAVFSYHYPSLIKIYKMGDFFAFSQAVTSFAKRSLLGVAILAVAVGVLTVPTLQWVGKPIYLEHLSTFYLLLTASAIYTIGHIPHYSLYAMGCDQAIVYTHIIGFISFLAFGIPLGSIAGANGVAFSLVIATSVIGGFKQWKYLSRGRSIAASIVN